MDHSIHDLGFGEVKVSYSDKVVDQPILIQCDKGDTFHFHTGMAVSIANALLGAVKEYVRWTVNNGGQCFEDIVLTCHGRSAIHRMSKPDIKYWKNHIISLERQVPIPDQNAHDWIEYDPREHKECPEFEETPA